MIARILGILVAVVVCNMGSLQAAPEVAGSLHVENLDTLCKSISAFAKNAFPDEAATIDMQMQGVPEMARQMGIDPSRSLGMVLLDPKDWGYALILPITDKQAIIDNPALGLAPSPDAPNNYLLNLPSMPLPLLVTFEGPYALLSTNAPALDQLRAAAKAGEEIVPKGAPIELNLAIDKIWPAVEPFMQGFFDSAAEAGTDEKQAAVIRSQLQAYVLLFRQTRSLGWRVLIEPEAVAMSWGVEALPGTDLEKFLKIEAGPTVDYLGTLPSNVAMRGTVSIKPGAELTETYLSFLKSYLTLAASASGKPVDIEGAEKSVQEMLTGFLQSWDGTGAFSMYSGTGMGVGAYGITDAAKAKAMVEKFPSLNKMLKETGELSGAPTAFELVSTSKYNDADIFQYKIVMDESKMTEEQREITEKMRSAMGYDKDMTTIYAVTPSKFLFSAGKDASESIKVLVDKFKQPSPPSDVVPSQFGFPANPHFFAVISGPRMIEIFSKADGKASPPAKADKQPPGLAMAAILNGKGEFVVRLTAAELKRIVEYSSQMKAADEPKVDIEEADAGKNP